MVDEARGDDAPTSGSSSYFARHWRGELSLPRSYWMNGALLFGLGANLLWILLFTTTLAMFRNTPPLAIVIGLALIALQIAAYIWALVGTWRAARNYRGSKVWSILARIFMSLGVFISLSNLMQTLSAFDSL